MSDKDRLTDTPSAYDPPRRPGQPGEQDQRRPGPDPASAHPAGPNPPYERDRSDDSSAAAIKHDAAGQYGRGDASPNKGGLHSANPVVLSGDGDATQGNGHGRDRDESGPKSG